MIFGNISYLAHGQDTNWMVFYQLIDRNPVVLACKLLYLFASWNGFLTNYLSLDHVFKLIWGIRKDGISRAQIQAQRIKEEPKNSSPPPISVQTLPPPPEISAEIQQSKEMDSSLEVFGGYETMTIDRNIIDDVNSPRVDSSIEMTASVASPAPMINNKSTLGNGGNNQGAENSHVNNNNNHNNVINLNSDLEREEDSIGSNEYSDRNHWIKRKVTNRQALHIFRATIITTSVLLSCGSQELISTTFYIMEAVFKTPVTFIVPAILYIRFGERGVLLAFVNVLICIIGASIVLLVVWYYAT
jgi:hypothetical protein